jgi:hypothetical protein
MENTPSTTDELTSKAPSTSRNRLALATAVVALVCINLLVIALAAIYWEQWHVWLDAKPDWSFYAWSISIGVASLGTEIVLVAIGGLLYRLVAGTEA